MTATRLRHRAYDRHRLTKPYSAAPYAMGVGYYVLLLITIARMRSPEYKKLTYQWIQLNNVAATIDGQPTTR